MPAARSAAGRTRRTRAQPAGVSALRDRFAASTIRRTCRRDDAATRRRSPRYGAPPRIHDPERDPGAGGAPEEPDRGEGHRSRSEVRPTAGAAATGLCGCGDDPGEPRHRAPPPPAGELHDCRQHGEGEDEAQRASELVVGLADLLATEVPGGRGQPPHHEVEGQLLRAARCPQRADQLQVLEEDIPSVAAGVQHRRAAHGEGPGPVPARRPRQQRACGVDPRVPRDRVEVVLGSHDGRVVQAAPRLLELAELVAHVVVGDHDVLEPRGTDARDDVADLPVPGPGLRCDGPHGRAEHLAVAPAHGVRRTVDDDDVGDAGGEAAEVGGELGHVLLGGRRQGQHVAELHQLACGRRLGRFDEDVGDLGADGGGHACLSSAADFLGRRVLVAVSGRRPTPAGGRSVL